MTNCERGANASCSPPDFRIAVISGPEPAPAARELFPDEIATKPHFLCFLFFVLQAG